MVIEIYFVMKIGDGDRDRPSNRPRNPKDEQRRNKSEKADNTQAKFPIPDNSDSEEEESEDDVIPEGKREVKDEALRKRKVSKSNEETKETSSSTTNTPRYIHCNPIKISTSRTPAEPKKLSPQQKAAAKDSTQQQLELLRLKHAARMRSAENITPQVAVSPRASSTLNYLILAIALTIALLLLRKYHSAPGYNNW